MPSLAGERSVQQPGQLSSETLNDSTLHFGWWVGRLKREAPEPSFLIFTFNSHLGHGRAAFQLYETLDIKYIQLDSLGHLLSRPLISMGLPQVALPILASTLKFYMTHAKEVRQVHTASSTYLCLYVFR